jgi:hypothetical protein
MQTHQLIFFLTAIVSRFQASEVGAITNLTECSPNSPCQLVVNSEVQFFGNNDTVTYFDPHNNGESINLTFSSMVTTLNVKIEDNFTAIDPIVTSLLGCACPGTIETTTGIWTYNALENHAYCDGEESGDDEANKYSVFFWYGLGQADQYNAGCDDRGTFQACIEYKVQNGTSFTAHQGLAGNPVLLNIEYNGTMYQLDINSPTEYSFGPFNVTVLNVDMGSVNIEALALVCLSNGTIISYPTGDVVSNAEPDCKKIGWYNGTQKTISSSGSIDCNYQATPIINNCETSDFQSQFVYRTLTSEATSGDFNWYGVYSSKVGNSEPGQNIDNPIFVTTSNQRIPFNNSLPLMTIIAPTATGGIHSICLDYPSICVCNGPGDRCVNGESKGGFVLLWNNYSIQGNYWAFIDNHNLEEVLPALVSGLGNIEFNLEATSLVLLIKSSQLIPEEFISNLVPVIWEASYSRSLVRITLIISSNASNEEGNCVIELSDGTSDSIYISFQNQTRVINSEASHGKIYCLNHVAQFNVEIANFDNDPGNIETGTSIGGENTSQSFWDWLLSQIYWIIALLAVNLLAFVYARSEFVSVDNSDSFFMKHCICLIAPLLGLPYFLFMYAENRHYTNSKVAKKELELQTTEKNQSSFFITPTQQQENEILLIHHPIPSSSITVLAIGKICIYLGILTTLGLTWIFVIYRL